MPANSEASEVDSLTPCPPWLLDEARRTLARDAAGRLPHALLLAGLPGIGKRAFGRWLVEALLCLERRDEGAEIGACGRCGACRQLLAGAHPDFRALHPDGASETIRIEAVRGLVDWLQLTARGGGRRIALLTGADTLNRNAANALLKTLEEPGEQGLLVLLADRPAMLPATVRSRCQRLTLHAGEREVALAWLAGQVDDPATALVRAGGRPFAALEVMGEERAREEALLIAAWRDLFLHRGSVGRIVDSLAELPSGRCLSAFSHWTALAVKRHAGLGGWEPVGADRAVQELVSEVAPRLAPETWFTVHDAIAGLQRAESASFKTRAVLEGLLADIRLAIAASTVEDSRS